MYHKRQIGNLNKLIQMINLISSSAYIERLVIWNILQCILP